MTLGFWLNIEEFGELNAFSVILRTSNTGGNMGGILVNINPDGTLLQFYFLSSPKEDIDNRYEAAIDINAVRKRLTHVTVIWTPNAPLKVIVILPLSVDIQHLEIQLFSNNTIYKSFKLDILKWNGT